MSKQDWCKQTGKRMLLVEGKTPESKIYLGRLITSGVQISSYSL